MTPPPVKAVYLQSTSSIHNKTLMHNTHFNTGLLFPHKHDANSISPTVSDCDESLAMTALDVTHVCVRHVPFDTDVRYPDILDVLHSLMSKKDGIVASGTKWNGERVMTFSGKSLLKWLQQQQFAYDNSQAVNIAQALVMAGGLVPTFRVERADIAFDPSTSRTYVHRGLTDAYDLRSPVLNTPLAYPLVIREGNNLLAKPRSMLIVLRQLSDAFVAICHKVVSVDGDYVEYAKLGGSAGWRRALVLLCELGHSSEEDFKQADDLEKKALWFNLYNLLIFHAKLVYGHPTDLVRRGKFFNNAAYLVAGRRITSVQLEHDVLRCRMMKGDARFSWRVEKTDPRMHFVLNCGAHSCPPLKPVPYTDTEAHLEQVTKHFIQLHVKVDDKHKQVSLSRLFKWFRHDFTPQDDNNSLLSWIAVHSSDEQNEHLVSAITKGYKVKFDVYDWADNGEPEAKPDIRFMAIYDLSFAKTA